MDITDLINYCPDKGQFYLKVDRGCKKAGDLVGSRLPNGYVYISISGKKYLAHRVAWLLQTGEWPTEEIDHIDRDKTNNRFSNLRLANRSQNCRNTTTMSGGASYHKRDDLWKSAITINYNVKVKYFKDKFDAHCHYFSMRNKYFGDYA